MDRFTLPGGAPACSGPGAAAFIEANTVTAFTYAAFGFILLLLTVTFYFLRKRKGLLIVGFSVAVLAAHPAWTIGAMIGDCGMSMVSMAKYATGALGAGSCSSCSYGLWASESTRRITLVAGYGKLAAHLLLA
jgi:hypothetical protein